jgi:hypothetical protein
MRIHGLLKLADTLRIRQERGLLACPTGRSRTTRFRRPFNGI